MRRVIPPEELTVMLPVGFRLEEDEDVVMLLHDDRDIATFSATGVDPRQIEHEAEECLLKGA